MFKDSTKVEVIQDTTVFGGSEVTNEPPKVQAPCHTAHISPRRFFGNPSVTYFEGAELLKVSYGEKCAAVGGGKRSRIKGFSPASRKRLMRLIAKLSRSAELPSFVTLTYPSEFPVPGRSKKDIDILSKRLKRAFPAAGVIWKLEPQDRGAPHFHMMIWGVEYLTLFKWVVENWYEIAGNGDPKHKKFHLGLFGNEPCVSTVRSWDRVKRYASKYLAKTFKGLDWDWPGRFWGVWGKENLPFAEEKIVSVSNNWVTRCMRYQKRFMGIRRLKTSRRKQLNSLTSICNVDQWISKLTEVQNV